jgi:PAS domain S-box-containing protein
MRKVEESVQAADAIKLNRLAEALVRTGETELASLSENAVRLLLHELHELHELQVHQVELVLQNEELSQTKDKVEAGLENYTELYDFAPVGYCTLGRNGTIRRVNLTGANLLGEQRSKLMNRSLGRFVCDENKPSFNEMLAILFNGQQKKALCEVVIHPKGLRSATPVKIVAMASATGDECLAVIIDITERKRLETQTQTANDELELRRVQERAAELLTLNRQLTQEIENRKKLEQTLRDSQMRLRNLSANLQFIREEERKAVAREIHDELGQLLATIQIGVSLLASEYSGHQKLVTRIHDIELLIADGIKTVQRISSELRPAMLDVLGLADALEWQGQEFQKRAGIGCKIPVLLLENRVHPEVATALFRIFQESLTNVQRHSQATKVEANLVQRGQHYSLTVSDNGRGITAEEISSPQSIGLIGIRERVFIIGGRMKIFGSPEQGTALFVRVPVNPKERVHVHNQDHHR